MLELLNETFDAVEERPHPIWLTVYRGRLPSRISVCLPPKSPPENHSNYRSMPKTAFLSTLHSDHALPRVLLRDKVTMFISLQVSSTEPY